jgi:D-lactate dehydrogenase
MKVAVFSAKSYDQRFLEAANRNQNHELVFFNLRLSPETAALANGCDAVCLFVNDDGSAPVLQQLADMGVKLLALRSAGFSHIDVAAAARLGLAVARVPAYSPHAVAEHALALILALNRKIHRAYNRVREGNFALEGLLGFDICGKTVGIIGTGTIGTVFATMMRGFNCRLIAYDVYRNSECEKLGVQYVELDELLKESDIISLHCPLTPATHHMIDSAAIAKMKPHVMLINTSRGAVIDTKAVIGALKSGQIGSLGLDVYEEEENLFFEDLSLRAISDDVFARLLTFPNVLITGHQAFFTQEALAAIAETTLANINAYSATGAPLHAVTVT